jgi:lipopolysaccharide/colanic/teichoic acid biosynthesis glycosyltransferase
MELPEKAHNISMLNAGAEVTLWKGVSYKDHFKRFFDIVFGILFLPITLPLLAVLMALIKLDSRGPAIYKSERVGKDGHKFFIYKLRTMCMNAEEKLEKILLEDKELRCEWEKDQKLKNDPRITRIGRIVRALSLDELPQVFNVIKGDMSFVGPRPIVEAEISKYHGFYQSYKSVRPGITGMWQVSGRNDTPYEKRVLLDGTYVENVNFILDALILLRTIPAAVSKKGAY